INRAWEESVDPNRKRVLQENLLRLPDDKIAQLSPSEAFIQSYIRSGPKAWYDPQFNSSKLWEGIEINMKMLSYMWGHVFREIDITKGLDKFQKPVFLALGRYDYLVAPPSTWDLIRLKFHDLTIRIFEKSGHTPQYEQPLLFDKELLEWLE
ncbi:MAG: alpha/beta hydrolase, partial [Bacteroidota bacterium]